MDFLGACGSCFQGHHCSVGLSGLIDQFPVGIRMHHSGALGRHLIEIERDYHQEGINDGATSHREMQKE
jgi:hypothetical protein